MRRTVNLWAALCVTALAGTLAAVAQPQALHVAGVTVPAAEPHDPPPLLTVAKGDHSGWGHDNPRFSGADFVIRNPEAWVAFWAVHVGEDVPPPPVDFEHRVVIATVQGPQPTGGGPNISVVGLHPEGPFTAVVIVDDERPGPIEVVTNPFHIVAVGRELLPPMRSVSFHHVRPLPESGTVVGRVFAAPPEHDPVPLFAAHVMLVRPEHEPRHALSGMDGSYFFVNVEPGEYLLVAEHPGFEPLELPISVPPATLVAHDLFLVPQHGVIAGVVLGQPPQGEPFPLAEALVQLF
ncbi:MAG: carboxypeptidase-like regulatory domain-containing protein, partial [Phycisphaerae bacterium]